MIKFLNTVHKRHLLSLMLIFIPLILLDGCGRQEKKPEAKEISILKKAGYFKNIGSYDSSLFYYNLVEDSLVKAKLPGEANDNLLIIAGLYRLKGNISKAYQVLGTADTLMPSTRTGVLTLKGKLLYDMGYYTEAVVYFEEALKNCRKNNPVPGIKEAECLDDEAGALLVLNKFEKAEEMFNAALAIKKGLLPDDDDRIIQSIINTGAVLQGKGNFDKALNIYVHALSLLEKKRDPNKLLTALLYQNIGIVCYRTGDFNKALDYFEKCLAIRQKILGGTHPLVAEGYNNFGLLYDSFSEPERAIDFYTKALDIRIKNAGEKQRIVARNYNNLANAYKDVKEYQKAKDYYAAAIKIMDKISPGDPDIGIILLNYGETYALTKDFKEAIPRLKAAAVIQEKTFSRIHPWLAYTYANLGIANSEYGNIKEAHRYLGEALKIAKDFFKVPHPMFAQLYNEYGRIEERKGRYKEALIYYQKAISSMQPEISSADINVNPGITSIQPSVNMLESLSCKASALYKLYGNNSGLTIATYDLTGELIDKIRSGFKEESSKLLLSENIKSDIEAAIRTYTSYYYATREIKYAEKAFAFCEKSKALTLLETLVDTKAKKFGGIPDSLLKKEYNFGKRLSEIDKKIYDAKQKNDSSKLAMLQSSLLNVKEKYFSLLEHFEKNYPRYYKLKYKTNPVTFNQVKKKITGKSSLLIEYFLGRDSLYIFTVSGDKTGITTVPLKESVDALVNNFRTGLKEINFRKYASAAFGLYNILLAPIKDKLKSKELVIIPDGIMNYIPFEALISFPPDLNNADYKKLHYLIYDYRIYYSYSATLLYENIYKEGSSGNNSFIGFAPY